MASDYFIGQCRYRASPSSQKVVLGSVILDEEKGGRQTESEEVHYRISGDRVFQAVVTVIRKGGVLN